MWDNLFTQLNAEGVTPVLLSNFDEPLDMQNDVDLFIDAHSREQFLSVLKKLGWMERREPAHNPLHHFYYAIHGDRLMCLDVKYILAFGAPPTDAWIWNDEALFLRTPMIKLENGAWRPSGLAAVLTYLIHIAKEKSSVQDRHLARIDRFVAAYRSEVDSARIELFDHVARAISLRDWNSIVAEFFRPANVSLSSRTRRLLPGLGYRLLVIGTDGTGKTTTLENIEQRLNIKSQRLYLGEKQWAIPWIGRYYARTKNALATWILYPLDLFLRTAKARRGGRTRVLLIDRFPGFPFTSPRRLMSLVYQCALPSIDLVVLLTGTPETIWQRKQEHSLEKTTADLQKWQTVFERIPGRKLMLDSTTHSPDELVEQILTVLFSDPAFSRRMFKPIA